MDFSFLSADSQQRPVGARDLEGCKGVWFELQICNGALGLWRGHKSINASWATWAQGKQCEPPTRSGA